jgi:hypothetical protein
MKLMGKAGCQSTSELGLTPLAKAGCKSPDSFGAPISNRLRIHEKAQATMVSLGSRVPKAECNSALRPLL